MRLEEALVTSERQGHDFAVSVEADVDVPGVSLPELTAWAESLVAAEAAERGDLAIRLTGDDLVRRLNREFSAKDATTDVLSFPGDPDGPEGPHLGDIVIAVPVATLQARDENHSLETELRLLILHGLLHCLGHDHAVDGGRMETLELKLRERWMAPER